MAEVSGRIYFGPTKTHQERVVVFPKFLGDRLEGHLEEHVERDPSSLVFTSASGAPLSYTNFKHRYWDRAVKAAGLTSPLGLHCLRHTYATLAAQAGASVKMVQTQLGHSDPALTLRVYQHLFEDDLDVLAERLDNQFGNAKPDLGRPEDGLALV